MSSRALVAGAACIGALIACGSSDSSALASRGGSGQAAGGAIVSGAGGAMSGGAFSGSGGTSSGGVGLAAGAGGSAGAGVTGGSPGILDAGSAGGQVPAEAAPPGAGGAFAGLPVGGLISAQCSDCAQRLCGPEVQACAADAPCTSSLQCLARCVLIQCVGCLAGGSSSPSTPSGALLCCTNRACNGICPNISGGLGGLACP